MSDEKVPPLFVHLKAVWEQSEAGLNVPRVLVCVDR